MTDSFQKKTSSILVTGLISVIVISFMFSGYESLKGSPDTVAKVGDNPIKYREFQAEFDRQTQFYSQMFGGQPLTSAQIESFNIKESVINNLINRKLIMKLADNIGIIPSELQIKKEIKDMPYFKTNEQFDFERYKMILANARLTPEDFEKDISEQIKGQLVQTIMQGLPISQNLLDDISKFKKEVRKANLIQFRKNDLKETLPVSENEIASFLSQSKGENDKKMKALFNSRKKSLDQPEQIKARHILLSLQGKNEAEIKTKAEDLKKQLTVKNFIQMANKYGEDPSSKNKGGDLGWFPRAQMVPEFDKVAFALKPGQISDPVKTAFGYHIILLEEHKAARIAEFADVSKNLAIELIRESKTKELDESSIALKEKLEKLLQEGKIAEIEKLQKSSRFTFEKDITINAYDGPSGNVSLDATQVAEIFANSSWEKSYILPSQTTLVKSWNLTSKEIESLKIDTSKDAQNLRLGLGRKLNEEILEKLKEKSKVKIYNVLN